MRDDIILSVEDLSIEYRVEEGTVKATNGISFALRRGQTLGLVGETGAGKTTIALGIMRLLPVPPAAVTGGRIVLEGEDLLEKTERQMRSVRGKRVSMIFQDPMTALNPGDYVGDQIREVILLHDRVSKAEARLRAEDALEMVGIPRQRYCEYPQQFSGGMKQRVIIAIALACNPDLLIADEPTTALDVTIQAQILQLMNKLKREKGTSNILITHNLGVIAEMCDMVGVVYAGEIIEYGSLEQVYKRTAHPYTEGLFGALPRRDSRGKSRLKPIGGLMPDPTDLPAGCKFAERCRYRTRLCEAPVALRDIGDGHLARCVAPLGAKKGE